MKEFETVLKNSLIQVYIDANGGDPAVWNRLNDDEKTKTLHLLLHGFLSAAAKHTKQ